MRKKRMGLTLSSRAQYRTVTAKKRHKKLGRHRSRHFRARCGASDASYRQAIPVLEPIESYRRLCSSGVGCAKITHMNRTIATSSSVNVSTARTIDPRQNASQWSHRYPPVLETNTLLAPGPRTWTIASAVAVIAHRQRPPTSSAPSMMAGCTISMTFQQSKPHSSWLPCDFSRACARRGVGCGRLLPRCGCGSV
jgi:hypothetical protein